MHRDRREGDQNIIYLEMEVEVSKHRSSRAAGIWRYALTKAIAVCNRVHKIVESRNVWAFRQLESSQGLYSPLGPYQVAKRNSCLKVYKNPV